MHLFLPRIFNKSPESLFLLHASENDLNCSFTKADQIISVEIEGVGNQEIFIAQFTSEDADIVRLQILSTVEQDVASGHSHIRPQDTLSRSKT